MKIKEKILLGIALLLFIVSSSYLLFYDQLRNSQGPREKKIGFVSYRVNHLKRKPLHSLVWEEVEESKELFSGDKVFTPAESVATLTIGESSSIEMSSLTLLNFDQSTSKNVSIELEKGILSAKINKNDRIGQLKIDGDSVDLNSKTTALIVDSGTTRGEKKITVLDGSATLTIAGKKLDINQNEMLKIDSKSGTTEKQKIKFRPTFPVISSIVTEPQLAKLTFSWIPLTQRKGPVKVEVARDHKFSKLAASGESKKESLEFNLADQTSGEFFWRIYFQDESPKEAIVEKFNVMSYHPAKLFYPAKNQVIRPPFDRKDVVIDFEWEGSTNSSFRLEFGHESDEKNSPPQSLQTNLPKASLIFAPGKYWWRIEKNLKGFPSLWSDKNYFEVLSPDSVLKPVYQEPRNHSTSSTQTITFKWQGSGQAEYKLLVARDQNFQSILMDQTVKGNSFEWKVNAMGNLFWKVTHTSLKDNPEVWDFNIPTPEAELISPADDKMFLATGPNQKMVFRWKDTYPEFIPQDNREFHFSISQMGQIVFQKSLQKTELDWLPTKNGLYEWEVKLSGGRPVTRKFKIDLAPLPSKPVIHREMKSKIKRRSTLNQNLYENRSLMLAQNSSVSAPATTSADYTYAEIDWAPIEEAKEYILEVYQDAEGKKLEFSRKIKNHFFDWSNPPSGTFYFRIAIIDKYKRQSPFSDLATLVIEDLREKRKSIAIVYPNNKFISHSEKQTFEWEGIEDASHYKVVLRIPKETKTFFEGETKKAYLLTSVPPGTYFWKVYAFDGKEEIAASEERIFKMVDVRKFVDTKNMSKHAYLKGYYQADLIYGNISSLADVYKSGEHFKSDESLSLFPGSMNIKLGQVISQEHFLTGWLTYKNGSNSHVNYSEFDFGGHWNWIKVANESFIFYYGPGAKYSSISFISDDSTKNLGASLNFISALMQGTLVYNHKNIEGLKQLVQLEGGASYGMANSLQGNISYDLRKSKISLLKNSGALYDKAFIQIGFSYHINNVTYGKDKLNMSEWRIPIGLGLEQDW